MNEKITEVEYKKKKFLLFDAPSEETIADYIKVILKIDRFLT
jgi:hypothetical protein